MGNMPDVMRALRRVRILELLPKGGTMEDYMPIINKYCESQLTVEVEHEINLECKKLIKKWGRKK